MSSFAPYSYWFICLWPGGHTASIWEAAASPTGACRATVSPTAEAACRGDIPGRAGGIIPPPSKAMVLYFQNTPVTTPLPAPCDY